MDFALWPVALRADLVRAFRPGEPPAREAPFRTLRKRHWATAGVPVHVRHGTHAAGRVVLFSILNVEAAISARCGDETTAAELAEAAQRLEQSKSFTRLQGLLAELPAPRVSSIAEGALARGRSDLTAILRELAIQTEAVRLQRRFAKQALLFHVGRISRVSDEYVVVTAEGGPSLAVPRILARAVHRDQIGDCLAVINTQVDAREIIVRAVPGIDLRVEWGEAYSPFVRTKGFEPISEADAAYLRGAPAPITIRIPVAIEP